MGSSCIVLNVENIWNNWLLFRRGKRRTKELDVFEYSLERNLVALQNDLETGVYRHGEYSRFMVTDNKRREISVASVRDRVVHRLLYGYLVEIYDKTFISDVWSCRKGKGLVGAIERTQAFLLKYQKYFVWRSDVRKFFDHVDHDVLKNILATGISDERANQILQKVIESYSIPATSGGGISRGSETRYSDRQSDESDFLQYLYE